MLERGGGEDVRIDRRRRAVIVVVVVIVVVAAAGHDTRLQLVVERHDLPVSPRAAMAVALPRARVLHRRHERAELAHPVMIAHDEKQTGAVAARRAVVTPEKTSRSTDPNDFPSSDGAV